MKYFMIFFTALFYLGPPVKAQSHPDKMVQATLDRKVMIRHDTLYLFYAGMPERSMRTDLKKTYYWYRTDTVFATVGGYGGLLLNGEYKVFYPDKGLKESGSFRNGSREGEWKTWYPDGTLRSVSYWKNGEEKLKKPKKSSD